VKYQVSSPNKLFLANSTPERPGDDTRNSKDQDPAESTDDLYPGIRDPEDFIFVWQQAVLPFLATFAKSWFGDEYTIGLRRGKSPGMRTINIMITNEIPDVQKNSGNPTYTRYPSTNFS
jgi:hypothetical protein